MVSELYVSLQGESSHQGKLCTFVRLTGCHLRCKWCDSEFSFKGGTRMSVDEVVAKVKALGAPMVEVTGGEPLLQPGVYPLMEKLLAAGLTVLLETSGAIDVREVPRAVHKIVDLKTPSSGEQDRNELKVFDSMADRTNYHRKTAKESVNVNFAANLEQAIARSREVKVLEIESE